jgi:chromosome segregation ATPase
MLDRLHDLRSQTIDQLDDLEDQIADLQEEQTELENHQRQYDQLHTRLDEIDSEIQDHEDRLAELEERESELTAELETLEVEVENLRTDEQSELIDLHAEASRLELELDTLEADLEEVTDDIEHIEDRLAQRDQLEAQREEIQAEIENLRTQIERLENCAVDEFNEHMDAVLDILGFENLERVWIERAERQVREGRKTVTKSQFDLHIVRSTESGTVYEDTVDHLSESEREVTGLVFALAGYLAHDLHETVPFMLLDSLEALDADRIDELIAYFQDYTEYLVVALLEEDANAVNSEYQRITDI